MNGDVPVLPLYAFRAWRGTTIDFTFYPITYLKPQSLHFKRHIFIEAGSRHSFLRDVHPRKADVCEFTDSSSAFE
jgi:hypothetical protein